MGRAILSRHVELRTTVLVAAAVRCQDAGIPAHGGQQRGILDDQHRENFVIGMAR